jgi:hypothetical protein
MPYEDAQLAKSNRIRKVSAVRFGGKSNVIEDAGSRPGILQSG